MSGPSARPARANEAGRSRPRAGIRVFLALFAAGLVGVVAALPVALPLVEGLLTAVPDAPDPSPATLVALALINPALILAVAAAVGTALAPPMGLRSHLASWAAGRTGGWAPFRAELPLAVALGVVVGAALVSLDKMTAWLLVPELAGIVVTEGRTFAVTLAGILYGGITEEVMVRWGLMPLLLWVLWRVAARSSPRPPARAAWGAIVLTALAFGALHLPALAGEATLTAGLVLRTVLLNALGGIAFGWLFWRRSLESAMVAHAMAHVAITAIALLPLPG